MRLQYLMVALFLLCSAKLFAQSKEDPSTWPVANKTTFLIGLGAGLDVNIFGLKVGIQHGSSKSLLRVTLGLGISSIPFIFDPKNTSYYPNPTIEYYFYRKQNQYLGVALGFHRVEWNDQPDISSKSTFRDQKIPLTLNYLRDIGDVHSFQFYASFGLVGSYHYSEEKESKSINMSGTMGFSYVF